MKRIHDSVQACPADKLHCRQWAEKEHSGDPQCIHCKRPYSEYRVAAIFSLEGSKRTINPFFTILNWGNAEELLPPDKDLPPSQPECGADDRKKNRRRYQ